MEAKEPEKKMPSTAAKATRRSAKEPLDEIHLKAQSAFFLMQGTIKEKFRGQPKGEIQRPRREREK